MITISIFPDPLEPAMPSAFISRLVIVPMALLLAACGVSDTGTAAVTAAQLKAREAEQAQAAKAQIEQQLEAANRQAEEQRKQIDAATR
ncbi:MAG: hypothetical protein JSR83_16975 [Proteobacteria bacterium]|nr:hypothetical protein [Pseudomonadota bacterium]